MAKRKTYEDGKVEGREEIIEIINAAPPIIAETPPLTITAENEARMKLDIADNFADLTDEDRWLILNYITSRVLNYVTTI